MTEITKIQGFPVIERLEYRGEDLEPFSDKENLYIPQALTIQKYTDYGDPYLDVSPYWLKIPLSLIRGEKQK